MTKEQINEFCKYLENQVKNNSIYVWGGQGELVMATPLCTLKNMETSNTNYKRVVKLVNNLIQCDKSLQHARMFDCSGLGTFWLVNEHILTSDTTADGLYKKCTLKPISNIKKGDFVFKVTTTTVKDDKTGTVKEVKKATHIGYVVDNDKSIIEAYGRDKGVVKNKLYKGSSQFTEAGVLNV